MRKSLLLVPEDDCINLFFFFFQVRDPGFFSVIIGTLVPFLSYFCSSTALSIREDPSSQKNIKDPIICLTPILC